MTSTLRLTAFVLAGLFLAFHLPFLARSLEDLDSINFALAIRDYDVARHQPHPPGYPLYIGAAKALNAAGLGEVRALSLLSVLGGAVGLIAVLGLILRLDAGEAAAMSWFTVPLVALNPLYWLTAVRPLSDSVGLAAALTAQWLILEATGVRALRVAAFVAGLGAGIRSQVVWLTVPLLAVSAFRLRAQGRRVWIEAAGAYVAGALLWAAPLLLVSGGPSAYWRAVTDQGTEDLTGVTLLANTPTLGQLEATLQHAFVSPWGSPWFAAAVLTCAVLGVARLAWRRQWQLAVTLTAAFVPYALFDLLFQEAVTTRYALPLVVPVVYLAGWGLTWVAQAPGSLLALGLLVTAVLQSDSLLYAYSRSEAPVFRMIGDMSMARNDSVDPAAEPVLAMHRRLQFDLRRPLLWAGDTLPPFRSQLASTPKHEWLEVVKYWNQGGRAPIWFLADPLRSDIALFGLPDGPTIYRWAVSPPVLLGGARPNEIDWYKIAEPDWYVGEGWALTPEAAGVAREDGKGPAQGGIDGWFRRWPQPVNLVLGGRNLGTSAPAPARIVVRADGQPLDEFSAPPGFFLRMLRFTPAANGASFVNLRVESDSRDAAIEQFDAKPDGRLIYGFGEGWYEREYDPRTGVSWRWSSDRSEIRVRAGGHAAALTLRGEIEEASASHVTIRAGGTIVGQFDVGRQFSRTVLIPAAALSGDEAIVSIESSATYVPQETRWRSRDRRRLGLKLFECRLTQAS